MDSSGITEPGRSLQRRARDEAASGSWQYAPRVLRVLQLARLDRVFTIHATLTEGLRRWRIDAGSERRPPGRPARRASTQGLEDLGLGGELFAQSLAWLVLGRRRRQPVRLAAIFEQMMSVGIDAILIVSILAATIGLMLAMQSIDALKQFGAETLVVLGIAPVLTREFAR